MSFTPRSNTFVLRTTYIHVQIVDNSARERIASTAAAVAGMTNNRVSTAENMPGRSCVAASLSAHLATKAATTALNASGNVESNSVELNGLPASRAAARLYAIAARRFMLYSAPGSVVL